MFSKKGSYIACSHRYVVSYHSLQNTVLLNFEFVTYWVINWQLKIKDWKIFKEYYIYITLKIIKEEEEEGKQNKQNLSFPTLVYGLTTQVFVTSS